MLLASSSKRLLRAAGGAEAALLGKHALQPVVGRAVRRALHDDTQTVLCMCMLHVHVACSERWTEGHRLEAAGGRALACKPVALGARVAYPHPIRKLERAYLLTAPAPAPGLADP